MGQVFIDFEVSNSADIDAARSVRSVALNDVLMDSGATHLCLPAAMIASLGLAFAQDVRVQTATGESKRRIFRNALVSFEDRLATVECIELPDGSPPLLGAIAMELLGIEPDLQSRTVRKRGVPPARSHVMA